MIQDPKAETMARLNSLADLVASMNGGSTSMTQAPNSMPFTLAANNSYTPLSLNRVTLAFAHMTQGLVRNMVEQPVEDAFRGGVEIESKELSPEELADLKKEINRNRLQDHHNSKVTGKLRNRNTRLSSGSYGKSDMQTVKETRFWARLFGGAGLIINTAQDFRTRFDANKITEGDPLEFIAADRWELILSATNIWDETVDRPYNYYGLPLHRSRVVPSMGADASSYVRIRLQGWGMSVLESAIRPINAFLKFEDVVFELLDEAKIDVYKIEGFNAAMVSGTGTELTKARIQLSNQLKNYQNAIVMDANDNYDKKQITFAGLADLWNECRRNLANALRIPMNKLFGESASGFGSGADSMENYNTIVASERDASEPLIREVVDLRCIQKFGYVPEYDLRWAPLKILDGEAEQMVKTAIQNRIMQQFQTMLITAKEASIRLQQEGLLPMETEVSKGLRDVDPMAMAAGGELSVSNEGKLAKGQEKREDKPRNDKKAGDSKKVG